MKKDKFRKFIWVIILIILPLFYTIHPVISNYTPTWNNIKNKDINKNMNLISSNAPPNGMIYANNSIFANNTYAVRLDGGFTIIENTLNIGKNYLNGIPVLNSTTLENSAVLANTTLGNINLLSNAKLILRNIVNPKLNIYLFDNSELILENCFIYSVYAFDSSEVWTKNSILYSISDTTAISGSITNSNLNPVSSRIHILNNSLILEVSSFMGSICEVDNSTINSMSVGGFSMKMGYLGALMNFIEPLSQAKITDSTITYFNLGGISIANIFRSNFSSISVTDLSYMTLNASQVTELKFGIVCYTGNTDINDGIPSGSNYFINSNLIGTAPSIMTFISVAVNNSATVNIKGWPTPSRFELYLHDGSIVNINDTISTNTTIYTGDFSKLTIGNSSLTNIVTADNSQLIFENSTISSNIIALSNSSVTIRNYSTIGTFFGGGLIVFTTGVVSVDNSSIYVFQMMGSNLGSPFGNVSITKSTIMMAIIYGSSLVTFDNCIITSLTEGIVVYAGNIIIDSTGISGSGSYTNYTNFISSTILTRNLGIIEVN
ncbi:MAG: hypothetical protein ACFFD2_25015, partial [Promethearchaeota archaeon]